MPVVTFTEAPPPEQLWFLSAQSYTRWSSPHCARGASSTIVILCCALAFGPLQLNHLEVEVGGLLCPCAARLAGLEFAQPSLATTVAEYVLSPGTEHEAVDPVPEAHSDHEYVATAASPGSGSVTVAATETVQGTVGRG